MAASTAMLMTSTKFNYDLILLMLGTIDPLDAALAVQEMVR